MILEVPARLLVWSRRARSAPCAEVLHSDQYGAVDQGYLVPPAGDKPLSQHRLAGGRGTAPASARRPGKRTGSERGLDGDRDVPSGLGVDDDAPAEQNTADDLPGVGRRVARADGGGGGTGGLGLGHTRDRRRSGSGRLLDTPDLQTPFTTIAGRRPPSPVRRSAGDHVANRSLSRVVRLREALTCAGSLKTLFSTRLQDGR